MKKYEVLRLYDGGDSGDIILETENKKEALAKAEKRWESIKSCNEKDAGVEVVEHNGEKDEFDAYDCRYNNIIFFKFNK